MERVSGRLYRGRELEEINLTNLKFLSSSKKSIMLSRDVSRNRRGRSPASGWEGNGPQHKLSSRRGTIAPMPSVYLKDREIDFFLGTKSRGRFLQAPFFIYFRILMLVLLRNHLHLPHFSAGTIKGERSSLGVPGAALPCRV